MLRIETRVLVIESGYESERDNVVLRTVNPGAAVLSCCERIAHGVDDFASLDPPGWDFPQLFDSDAVGLGVAVFHQIEFLDELLGKRSSGAFGEDDNLGLHVVA